MNIFKRLFSAFIIGYFKLVYIIYKAFPINSNLIVLDAVHTKSQYNDLFVIYDELKRNYPEYKLVFIYDKKKYLYDDVPNKVSNSTYKYWYYLARAQYIFCYLDLPFFFSKRKTQVIVQTFLPTTIRKYDHEIGDVDKRIKKALEKMMSKYDFLLSPNSYSSSCFRDGLFYDNEIIELGLPRNKLLYDNTSEQVKTYRDKFQIDQFEDKVVIYVPLPSKEAPTKPDIQLDLQVLEDAPGIKTYIYNQCPEFKNDVADFETVFCVQEAGQLRELLIISDMLVTDYHPIMFEYLILDKPIVLFPYDLESHVKENRLYMDYNLLPAEQIDNTQRLIQIATNLNPYKSLWAEERGLLKEQMVLETDVKATELILKEVLKNKYYF